MNTAEEENVLFLKPRPRQTSAIRSQIWPLEPFPTNSGRGWQSARADKVLPRTEKARSGENMNAALPMKSCPFVLQHLTAPISFSTTFFLFCIL